MLKRRSLYVLLVSLLMLTSACSREQVRSIADALGVNATEEQVTQITEAMNRPQAKLSVYRTTHLTGDQLRRLRNCESTNNYSAVSRNGKYRGAYQFNRSTWNSVAGSENGYPEMIGVDPATAPPQAQDAMADLLYSQRGRSPWPICGRRI